MSGVVEDLTERLSDLERVVVKLCRRAGHDYDLSDWERCGRTAAQPSHFAKTYPEDHRTKCQTCGTFKCEEEGK